MLAIQWLPLIYILIACSARLHLMCQQNWWAKDMPYAEPFPCRSTQRHKHRVDNHLLAAYTIDTEVWWWSSACTEGRCWHWDGPRQAAGWELARLPYWLARIPARIGKPYVLSTQSSQMASHLLARWLFLGLGYCSAQGCKLGMHPQRLLPGTVGPPWINQLLQDCVALPPAEVLRAAQASFRLRLSQTDACGVPCSSFSEAAPWLTGWESFEPSSLASSQGSISQAGFTLQLPRSCMMDFLLSPSPYSLPVCWDPSPQESLVPQILAQVDPGTSPGPIPLSPCCHQYRSIFSCGAPMEKGPTFFFLFYTEYSQ